MILSVATSVVFLFLTRKGHLLPPAAQGGPLDRLAEKSSSLYEGTENKNFFRFLSIES